VPTRFCTFPTGVSARSNGPDAISAETSPE
jgi:hypothetical protein